MSILTESARGESCTMNVSGVCNYDSATVVFAHFRWIGDCGMGNKPSDFQGAAICSACHSWLDSPTPAQRNAVYEADRNFYAIRAIARTLKRLDERGVIKVARGRAA